MTLTLVPKKKFHHKEDKCEIWKLYHLPFKSHGQCKKKKKKCTKTGRQKNWAKTVCPNLSMEGHRNLSLEKVKQFGFIIHSNNETSNLRNYHDYNAVIFDHNMNI